jgi:protein gp37
MGEKTGIAWTDHTWNPWWGCQAVSPACDHCYAEALDKRYTPQGQATHFGPHAVRRRTGPGNWNQPLKWNHQAGEDGVRRRIFTASMADFFDNAVDPAWRRDAWDVIRECRNLDWQIVSKRMQNAPNMLPPDWGAGWDHVWLGTTVENQVEANRRIPALGRVPAKLRFLSCEPMLERIDPSELLPIWPIDWVICGGESGPGARPMRMAWAVELLDFCLINDIPFFFKQWGEWAPAPPSNGDTFDAHKKRGAKDTMFFPDGSAMELVGKKRAGNLLLGMDWLQFPNSPAARHAA